MVRPDLVGEASHPRVVLDALRGIRDAEIAQRVLDEVSSCIILGFPSNNGG